MEESKGVSGKGKRCVGGSRFPRVPEGTKCVAIDTVIDR